MRKVVGGIFHEAKALWRSLADPSLLFGFLRKFSWSEQVLLLCQQESEHRFDRALVSTRRCWTVRTLAWWVSVYLLDLSSIFLTVAILVIRSWASNFCITKKQWLHHLTWTWTRRRLKCRPRAAPRARRSVLKSKRCDFKLLKCVYEFF